MRFIKTKSLVIVAILLVGLIAAGCTKPEPKPTAAKKPGHAAKDVVHSLSKADEAALLKSVQEDLQILAGLGEDTAPLANGFTSDALTGLVNAAAKDRAAGKRKVRVFENTHLFVSFATKKLAAVRWTYLDKSYYVNRRNVAITPPANIKQRFNLAVANQDGRWKIGQIMSEIKQPEQPKKPKKDQK